MHETKPLMRDRRTILGWAGFGIGAGILAACTSACTTVMSVFQTTKQDAMYQDQAKNGQVCAGCTHFKAPNQCWKVEGTISAGGWCRFWAARS